MTIYKVAELEGDALDLAVAMAVGQENYWREMMDGGPCFYSPSTDWELCGYMIEKYGITIMKYADDCPGIDPEKAWVAQNRNDVGEWTVDSKTPLIAACRAIVSAKYGEIIDLPL